MNPEESQTPSPLAQVRAALREHRQRAWLLAAGVLVVLAFTLHGLPGTAGNAAAPARPQSIAVDATEVRREDVPVYLQGLGTIQAFNTVTVTARVDGELQKIGFVEGQTVRQGDLLAQIDPRPFEAALHQAEATKAKDEAQLLSARADLERYQTLAPANLTSQQTLDSQRALVAGLEAQIKGDQASIDNARTQLQYTTITSPIQGKTGIRRVDVGNNVHSTDTNGIVVVTQMQPIAFIFTLPEDSLPTVSRALNAGAVTVEAMARDGSEELDRGTVTLVDNQIDQSTGTIRLKAVFPNGNNRLWPGQYLDARVLVRTEQHALTIPTAAVQRGPNGVFAYVIKADSTVEARPLKVGEESGAVMIVKAGMQEGERVVTSNQYRLQPGAAVKITPTNPTATPAPTVAGLPAAQSPPVAATPVPRSLQGSGTQ